MALQQYTTEEFRSSARHFTEEAEIEVSGVRIHVWPSKVTPTDGTPPYHDTKFTVGHKHGSRFVLLNTRRGWNRCPHSGNHWTDVRRQLGI